MSPRASSKEISHKFACYMWEGYTTAHSTNSDRASLRWQRSECRRWDRLVWAALSTATRVATSSGCHTQIRSSRNTTRPSRSNCRPPMAQRVDPSPALAKRSKSKRRTLWRCTQRFRKCASRQLLSSPTLLWIPTAATFSCNIQLQHSVRQQHAHLWSKADRVSQRGWLRLEHQPSPSPGPGLRMYCMTLPRKPVAAGLRA